jgi:hypothetical protein
VKAPNSECPRNDLENLDYSQLESTLQNNGKDFLIDLPKSVFALQAHHFGDIQFDFDPVRLRRDVQIDIRYLSRLDLDSIKLSGCLCLSLQW